MSRLESFWIEILRPETKTFDVERHADGLHQNLLRKGPLDSLALPTAPAKIMDKASKTA